MLRVDDGKFGFMDARGARATGMKMIVCEMTMKGGAVEWDLTGRATEDWTTVYAPKTSSDAARR